MTLQKGKLYTYTIDPGYTHEMFPDLGIQNPPIRSMNTGDVVIYLDTEKVPKLYNPAYQPWKRVIVGDLVGWIVGTLTPFEENSNGCTTSEG